MKLYGSIGRIISTLSVIAASISALLIGLQSQGVFNMLPPKVVGVLTAVIAACVFIAGISERIQGGASKPEVRQAAAASDRKNELGVA